MYLLPILFVCSVISMVNCHRIPGGLAGQYVVGQR